MIENQTVTPFKTVKKNIRANQPQSQNLQSQSVSFLGNDNSRIAHSTELVSKTASSSIGSVSRAKIGRKKSMPAMQISFQGNKDKKPNQFLYIAPEMRGIAGGAVNGIYSEGGLGVVTDEAANNVVNHYADKKADVRVILPYHTDENSFGDGEFPGGLTVAKGDAANPEFRQVAHDHVLGEGERFAVVKFELDKEFNKIQVPVDPKVPDGPKKIKAPQHVEIEDTGVKGIIKRISENFSEIEQIPYRLFKVKGTGQKDAKGKRTPTVYLMHTPEAATFRKAYDLDAIPSEKSKKIAPRNPGNTAYGGFHDLIYANNNRASIDAIQKLNTEGHGDFNPANIWLHDRQAFGFAVDAAEQSAEGNDYFHGLKMHSSYHNPGRAYQGAYDDPLEFFRIVASEKDFASLKEHSEFDFIKDMVKKGKEGRESHGKARAANPKLDQYVKFENLYTEDEARRIKEILDPVIGGFKDDFGTYNMCAIPVQAIEQNPANASKGTVSRNFGREMISSDTPDIAPGMTRTLAKGKSIDVTNGSTPANMKTGEVDKFGAGDVGFNKPEVLQGYTPYTPKIDRAAQKVLNIDEVYEAKQKNKAWLIDTIAKATEESKLPELFYTQGDINKGATILGGLSKYQKGDVLYASWGRPDEQKGLPTLLDSFIHFYKREDVSREDKLKVKLITSAGVYPKDNPDWKIIEKQMKEIAEIDGGAFKHNVCFINGRFTSRMANGADWTKFTSRFEPCGITPLESAAAGTPVSSIKTGGAPDFITPVVNGDTSKATGTLTETAFLVKPEVMGKDVNLGGAALDDARRAFMAPQLSNLIKEEVAITANPEKHKKMQENQLLLEIDWHNNNAFNNGRSANQVYFEDAFGITEKLKFKEERNKSPLKNLKGKIVAGTGKAKEVAEKAKEEVAEKATDAAKDVEKGFFSTTKGKVTAGVSAGAVLLGLVYYTFGRENKEKPAGFSAKA